ncbi:transporter substrate-binding domain-containing protein [Pantoea sp. Tr-811]|uniref:substrate-binding periplasmic protein n=1 Tax=Pantoea sp. Tr-811 TaxID=2608361 RepID=UPI0014226CF8|nr:transporter substrate-binding domain-containing protein [Pantoea sp. Tr-811]NIF28438.1 transporter substrate-binding domain-containing protein [Pantoea sp. Tr-811]
MFQVPLKWVKALTAVSLVAAFSASSAMAADAGDSWKAVREAGVLRCGAATSPPYVMRDPRTGDYSGLFPDLCKQFGEQVLKVKVQFVDTSWDNIVAGLQSQKWDLSLALNDTPERRKAISFSKPAIGYSVNFAYNSKNPKLAAGVAGMADIDKPGISVAVMSGTAQDKAISAVLKQATIVRLPGFDETRLSLMAKRSDFLADDSMTNTLLTSAHPDWAKTFTPTPKLAEQGINLGVNKNTPAEDIAVLDAFIEAKIASGEMDKMAKHAVDISLAASN